MKYPCKKQRVFAFLVCKNGMVFPGENWCKNDIQECPRAEMATGKGYELCKSVCGQENHAEVDAIKKAGENAHGGKLYLFGHSYCCEDCKKEMEKYGVIPKIKDIAP